MLVKTTISLPLDEYNKIREFCKDEGRLVSPTIRKAMKDFMSDKNEE